MHIAFPHGPQVKHGFYFSQLLERREEGIFVTQENYTKFHLLVSMHSMFGERGVSSHSHIVPKQCGGAVTHALWSAQRNAFPVLAFTGKRCLALA